MHDAQNTCLNACHTPRKKCACTRACAPMQRCRKFFAMETIANLSRVLCEHRAGCRLPPTVLLSRRKQSPDVVGSRNPSKSRLAHDAVAAAVSHKHHSIIRVGAGLIQFVHGLHSKRGHGAHPSRKSIFATFLHDFSNTPLSKLGYLMIHTFWCFIDMMRSWCSPLWCSNFNRPLKMIFKNHSNVQLEVLMLQLEILNSTSMILKQSLRMS